MTDRSSDRYPGYDVLAKRNGPSWNAKTREVIDERLAIPLTPHFFNVAEWRCLGAVCDRIIPQPPDREKVPVPSYVDDKMHKQSRDGYRYPGMPEQGEAWRHGLAALDEAARRDHGKDFAALDPAQQDAMLGDMQHDRLKADALAGMPAKSFFQHRIIHDICAAYYAHPTAWNEIGFGGPASPRGYVRLELDRRDPWEAAEAHPGREKFARKENARVR